jgi:predicted DNA-binding transcriptional regulator AlpA
MNAVLDRTPTVSEVAARIAAEFAGSIGFYSEAELDAITSLSRVTRWRLTKQGKFPPSVELSPGRKGTPKAAVHEWIKSKLEAGQRDAAP